MIDKENQLQEFWDKRYENPEYIFGTAPNDYLRKQCSTILPSGNRRALCLADGEGRNGVWLAQQGWDVTGVDISPAGIDKAKQLALKNHVQADFLVGNIAEFDFKPNYYQLITSIFFHLPKNLRQKIHEGCILSLEIGGFFVMESYSPEQLSQNTGGPKEPELLISLEDVREDFLGKPNFTCEITHEYSGPRHVLEGIAHKGDAFVTQLTVRRLS